MSKSITNQFRLNIIQLRKSRALTQDCLARKLQTKRSNIGAWEEGRATPSFEVLVKMSDVFRVSVDDLLKKSAATIME